jgi:hypothetical protein
VRAVDRVIFRPSYTELSARFISPLSYKLELGNSGNSMGQKAYPQKLHLFETSRTGGGNITSLGSPCGVEYCEALKVRVKGRTASHGYEARSRVFDIYVISEYSGLAGARCIYACGGKASGCYVTYCFRRCGERLELFNPQRMFDAIATKEENRSVNPEKGLVAVILTAWVIVSSFPRSKPRTKRSCFA